MPPVGGGGDMLKHRSIRHSSDASIIRTVANTDVDCAAVADDLHPRNSRLLRFRYRLRLRLLSDIVVGDCSHKRGMGLIAVLTILL